MSSGVQGSGSELAEWIERARAEFAERKASKRAKREAAKTGSAPDGSEQDKRKMAAKAKALTKALVPLASVGALDGIKKAFEQGADPRACEKGVTPLMAAIAGGHRELAHWLLSRGDHAWAEESKGRSKFTELSAAVRAEDIEMCDRLVAARPSLLGASMGEARWNASLFEVALDQAPKAAAWLIRTGLWKKLPKGRSMGLHSKSKGLAKSLSEKDFDTAAVIFDFIEPSLASSSGPLREEQLGYGLLADLLEADDAEGLAWCLGRSERLAAAALSGIEGACASSMGYWLGPVAPLLSARMARLRRGASDKNQALMSTLPAFAACEGAADCLRLLLAVPHFREQIPKMQAEPESYCWEALLLTVNDPAIAEALGSAGFDFKRRLPEGWNYLGAVMAEGRANLRWLEFIGRKMPELLSPAPPGEGVASGAEGKTAFDMVAGLKYPSRSLGKWRSVCEKASIKSHAGRARGSKQARAKGQPKRL